MSGSTLANAFIIMMRSHLAQNKKKIIYTEKKTKTKKNKREKYSYRLLPAAVAIPLAFGYFYVENEKITVSNRRLSVNPSVGVDQELNRAG